MSSFLSGFFARRAANPANTPQANPAAQFDILLSQYNSNFKALGESHFSIWPSFSGPIYLRRLLTFVLIRP